MKTIVERAKEFAKDFIFAENDMDCGDCDTCITKCKDYLKYIDIVTEQKAIDEEVRLKKSDDMTQAEYDREVAFADWYHQNREGTPTYSDAIEWARKAVIEEARDWFSDYLMEIGYPDDWMRDSPNMLSGEERFRKAMEE